MRNKSSFIDQSVSSLINPKLHAHCTSILKFPLWSYSTSVLTHQFVLASAPDMLLSFHTSLISYFAEDQKIDLRKTVFVSAIPIHPRQTHSSSSLDSRRNIQIWRNSWFLSCLCSLIIAARWSTGSSWLVVVLFEKHVDGWTARIWNLYLLDTLVLM